MKFRAFRGSFRGILNELGDGASTTQACSCRDNQRSNNRVGYLYNHRRLGLGFPGAILFNFKSAMNRALDYVPSQLPINIFADRGRTQRTRVVA
jgi:hypothetical protein